MKRFGPAALAFLVLMLVLTVTAAPAARPAVAVAEDSCVQTGLPNLLQNPSFEHPYDVYTPPGGHPQCPAGVCTSVRTAAAWLPWWRIQAPEDKGYEFKMPEMTAAEESKRWYGPPRARSGDAAQQLFTLYATHEAGVYQQVAVEPGVTYCFSVWGHSWTAQDDPIPELNHSSCPSPQGVGDACSGPEDGQLRQKIGIDPTGGTDWTGGEIIWSDQATHPHGRQQYDSFGLFVVTATAQAETITVFTYARPSFAVKHNNVYWDDATLSPSAQMVVSGAGQLAAMSTVTDTVQLSQTITIDLLGPAGASWTAGLEAGATVTPTLSQTGGQGGESLTIGVDTSGLPAGSYRADVTISASAPMPGSPVSIPVFVYVVDRIHTTFTPLITRP